MKNFFKSLWNWFKNLFTKKVGSLELEDVDDHYLFHKSHSGERGKDKPGAFKNNRKRSAARRVQYVFLKDGTTKRIFHEPR
jgi:hypothetical protein